MQERFRANTLQIINKYKAEGQTLVLAKKRGPKLCVRIDGEYKPVLDLNYFEYQELSDRGLFEASIS